MLQVIVTTLQELTNIQKQLIAYAEQKRTVLIERKVDELNQLVTDEAKLLQQLEQLENERVRLVGSVMQQHPSLSFNEFIEQLSDEATKNNIQLQMKTLQQLMVELQAKNKVNERLLKDSMSFVHHMIDQVTKTKKQTYNYQSPVGQQKSQTSGRGFFDTKA